MSSSANHQEQNESAIRSLFRLVDEVSGPSQETCSNEPVAPRATGKQASNKSMDAPTQDPSSGLKLFGALAFGAILGGFVGWQARGAMHSTPLASHYRPASLAEAHRLLQQDGFYGGKDSKPLKLPPLKIVPAYQNETIEKSVSRQVRSGHEFVGSLPSSTGGTFRGDVGPLAVTMPGSLPGTLPSTGSASFGAVAEARPNLHGTEAKVRTAIVQVGGRVSQAQEADGSVTLIATIKPDAGSSLRSAVRRASDGHASVSEITSDDSASDIDPVQAAELRSAEETVTTLKSQLAKDEISFLPEAPVLKSARAEYTDAVRNLARLQRANKKSATFQIVLSS
jgi:hypothetical protein